MADHDEHLLLVPFLGLYVWYTSMKFFILLNQFTYVELFKIITFEFFRPLRRPLLSWTLWVKNPTRIALLSCNC